MSSRSRFHAFVSACLVVGAAGASHAAPAPREKTAKPAGYDLSSELKKYAAWSDQCRAGTFDFRAIQGSDLAAMPDVTLAGACLSLSSTSSAPRKTSGNPSVDAKASRLAGNVSAIQGAVSGNKSPEDLCRLVAEPDSAPSALDMRRCGLLFPILRQKQDSGVLCKQARELGIADENFGCSPAMRFVDGRPDRCGDGPVSEECRELAGLLAALRSGAPKDCASSPFCKVLASRDVRDCEPYLKRANKTFCDRIALNVAQLKRLDSERAKKDLELEQELARQEQELLKQEAAKKALEQERKARPSFKKGEPMQAIPPDVEKRMKKIEATGQPAKQP